MKNLLAFILFFFFSISISGQNESYAGNYEFLKGNKNFTQSLTLNSDGTFVFHSYEYHEAGIPKEKNYYAKGSWRQDKNIICFSTKPSDLDNKYTVDFNNSKARFDTKSPRDKSNRDVKTSIRFYDCDIFWVIGKTFYKVE